MLCLIHTLINIRLQLLGSLAIFILAVLGFSMSGYLLFCPYVETFRSLSAATVGLTFLPWGQVSYAVLATPSELVGPLFLFASGFTILYLLLSLTAGVFVSATSAMMGEKGRGKKLKQTRRKPDPFSLPSPQSGKMADLQADSGENST
ncbi:hypothetical protein Bbelb_327960 [Branchiostoma belcheri]|nr:hypothetical protein Bbelb_327960 [Branchiostoma belcheri]